MSYYIRNFASKYLWRFILALRYLYYRIFADLGKEVIVVLSPGKVGSTSVYNTIKKYQKNAYVFHLHFLESNNIEEGINFHRKSLRKSVPYHFISSKIFAKVFLKKKECIKFVILFRDPIKRFISDSFQNSDRITREINITNYGAFINEVKDGIRHSRHLSYLDNWIRSELEKNLKYNFYERCQLDRKDFYIDECAKYSFLFIKMEALSSIFAEASYRFFDEKMMLENHNLGSEKNYHEFYKKAQEDLLLNNSEELNIESYTEIMKIYPCNR